MSHLHIVDEHGEVDFELDDDEGWAYLQQLDQRFLAGRDLARDLRFEAVMAARSAPARPKRRRRA